MGLEDINAEEEKSDRAMDKYVPWISGVMAALTMWFCIHNEINCHFDRERMNEEMQDFRKVYPRKMYCEELKNYG